MNYEYVFFDLDGTLTDPALGITNSILYALKKYGIMVKERSELYPWIGPPLHESFQNYYNFSEEESKKAVEIYREYFGSRGLFENKVYDGIPDLLDILKKEGKSIVLATSKPTYFAEQILEYFDLLKNFSFVAGSNLDGTRTEKSEVIEFAINSCKITDLSKVIMIGDREYDIIGAKKCGIPSVGVLYGYGTKDELEQAGAKDIAQRVEDIRNFV